MNVIQVAGKLKKKNSKILFTPVSKVHNTQCVDVVRLVTTWNDTESFCSEFHPKQPPNMDFTGRNSFATPKYDS